MAKFSWGEVLDRFEYNFDGQIMEVTKFHPWTRSGCTINTGTADYDSIEYHCAELHESSTSLQYLLLAWIAYKNLGNNNGSLVYGLSKALDIKLD